jgi:MarR family transcriptional regulator, transcriptional regulator for hemolysin
VNNAPTISFLLHEVARLLRKRFEQRAKCFGLTRTQWQTLAYLANNEGIHQAGLAEILEIEPITLVRILDKLQGRDLIERRRHATDRRIWRLYLREETRPLLASMRVIGEATRAEALADVPAEDREHLIRTLTLMKSNLIDACQMPVEDGKKNHG